MVPGGQVQSQQYNAGTVVEYFVKASCLASVEKCHFGKSFYLFLFKSCLFFFFFRLFVSFSPGAVGVL